MAEPHLSDTSADDLSEPPAEELEALGSAEGQGLVAALVAEELDDDTAQAITRAWRARDEWSEEMHPHEGLRERKKRLTRQRISDVATLMFVTRGFETVRISEIAEVVGVSEKTVYNYFPTKESLVFDEADAQLDVLTAAIRDRPDGTSPTAAFVAAMKQDMRRFSESLGPARLPFISRFTQMIDQTPALQAAWGEHRHRMVHCVTEVLAEGFAVDPRDPEMVIAARSLVSLLELYYDSQIRRLQEGGELAELQRRVDDDLDRGARLTETGMWSLHVLVEGRRSNAQVKDLALAAEQARQQVITTLREAKAAFREIQAVAREAHRAHHAADERGGQSRQAQREAQRALQSEIRAAVHEARAAARKRK